MFPTWRTAIGVFWLVMAVAATVAISQNHTNQGKDAAGGGSLTTQERLYAAAWWPTQGEASAKEYAGEAACAKCHGDITARQHATPMYHAAALAAGYAIPGGRSSLKFQEGSFKYSMEKSAAGLMYSVNGGSATNSKIVEWVFGNGEMGKTYLLNQEKMFVESRLSYYARLGGLDITTGHSEGVPASPQAAFGHELTSETAERCFGCHTTESMLSGVFNASKAVPGVTCEACHGPGAAHVAAEHVERAQRAGAKITNPGAMSPRDSVDFCGACHRTFSDVAVYMPATLGAALVRFQPYRLEKSRCWGRNGDARITCIACHDPHQPLRKDGVAYDVKCLACHGAGAAPVAGATAAACKVGKTNCASCHMPKVEVPQAHASFTDHDIRIVRAASVVGGHSGDSASR